MTNTPKPHSASGPHVSQEVLVGGRLSRQWAHAELLGTSSSAVDLNVALRVYSHGTATAHLAWACRHVSDGLMGARLGTRCRAPALTRSMVTVRRGRCSLGWLRWPPAACRVGDGRLDERLMAVEQCA